MIKLLLAIALGFLGLTAVEGGKATPPQNSADPQVKVVKNLDLNLEVADTDAKREQGLSGRSKLPDNQGMLFSFEQPSFQSFWMKDMSFSLDFLWLDENKEIVDLTQNVAPETYPGTFSPKKPVKYVVEVGAGYVEANSLKIGETLSF